ncbi:MAG: 2-dehydro-3-deoxyglucarate aldolase [Planctomycetaceae bacterium]|jgi:2-keto-3-deoxy-L-rhamnonate aldolase RhmA|nr:2-dehydro-3-deoxyglucarate aldolase [Planctomycetaceae bacterium]MBP60435.1 2-dehydro-3-deoxyglucarate aldolase [Planctomycetaceae bacterium]
MQSRFKELLDAGRAAFGTQLRFGSPGVAELFGHAGFDWIILDAEHAPQTPVGIQSQLQAIGNTPATPIVRLPKVDEEQIRLYLDMGAMGILAAFINTAEDAELGARACRYPPLGNRGWGPHRAAQYGLQAREYTEQINDLVVFMGLIETKEAVENIDAILAVEGMDTHILGPVDLSISLGVPFDFQNSTFQDAEQQVRDAARRAGKPAGIGVYDSPFELNTLKRVTEAGYQAILVGGDELFLTHSCQQIKKIRTEL